MFSKNLKKISNDEMREQMLNRSIGGLLFQKAFPTVIIQLITVIYNTADTYFVAKISTEASAAVGVVFSLMAIIQAFGFGIGMGSGSIISRKLGAKKEKEANTFGSSALAAAFLCGLFLLMFGLLNVRAMFSLIGASENVLPYAVSYGSYILWAAPVMCMSFVFNNILRSEGQTFLAMMGMTAGGILNCFLDPIFIFGFGMGIGGAAAATALSQLLSFCILGSFFARKKSITRLSPKYISKEWYVYGEILKTGFPTICRQGLGSLSSAVLNVQASMYGDATVAAVSIANKLYMLARNIVLGIGQGYQPIAGFCFGAGKKERVKKLFWMATAAGTVVCLIFSVGMGIAHSSVMAWFRDDPEVIVTGSHMLIFMCVSMPVLAYSTYVNQTYQCLGFAKGATFLACCRQGICFIPLAFILPPLLGVTGIEMLQPAADILTFAISVPMQVRFFKKHLKTE